MVGSMKNIFVFIVLSILCIPVQAKTELVYDWSDGFKIQSRADKITNKELEYIGNYVNNIIKKHNRQLILFYNCRDNNGGSACYKYLEN